MEFASVLAMSRKPSPPQAASFSHRPFAVLQKGQGLAPSVEATPEREAPVVPDRAVVRLQRKGRAGKEVTAVEKLGLDRDALADWAHQMKRSLGCGGAVEGDSIVLQGGQRERAAEWLRGRGVKTVTMG